MLFGFSSLPLLIGPHLFYPQNCISKFNGKPEFFVYGAFIANTEIVILLLFNIVPF